MKYLDLLHLLSGLIVLFAFVSKRKKKRAINEQELHKYEVIIATKGERAESLGELLLQLKENLPKVSVSVVLDIDAAQGLPAFLYKHKSVYCKFLFNKYFGAPSWNGKKGAIQTAIEESRASYFLFLDDDCKLINPEQWFSQYQLGFESGKEVIYGFAPLEDKSIFSLPTFEAFFTQLQMAFMHQFNLPYLAIGRNWGYSKQAFNKVQGFNTIQHLQGGDDDLLLQKMLDAKCSIHLITAKQAGVLSKTPANFRKWEQQKNRHYGIGWEYAMKYSQRAIFSGVLAYIILLLPLVSVIIGIATNSLTESLFFYHIIIALLVYYDTDFKISLPLYFFGAIFYLPIHLKFLFGNRGKAAEQW